VNSKKIALAIIVILLAIGGLIAFQLYWIKSAVEIKQERFDASVSEALHKVAYNLEKKAVAAKVTRRLNMHRQSERDDHLSENKITFNKRKNDYKDMRLNVFEEIITDSGGFKRKDKVPKLIKAMRLTIPILKLMSI